MIGSMKLVSLSMEKKYTVLNWRRADANHRRDGYYCAACGAYIGKTAQRQFYCPVCKCRVCGKYA